MKRVFIIHGWGGHPKEAWFPWLKQELEKKGFLVEVPAMPDTDNPKIEAWVPLLAKLVGKPDKDTYFVGHSIGCQTILRYLETVREQVGGAVFVAGWFTLKGLNEQEQAIVRPWLDKSIDFASIKKVLKTAVAIFSDNDNWVDLDNATAFEKKLGARTIIEQQKGHFSGSDNVNELPSALDAVLRISNVLK